MLKTPFYPGRAVTTEFLNSSQFFGPGNPGISFVANPLNFWEYPLLDLTNLDTNSLDARYITKGGNVSITGTKTFLSAPRVPDQVLGTSDSSAANTQFVIDEINSSITSGGFVDLGSTQIITGLKTFVAIRVPLVPLFVDSPVSLSYSSLNFVHNTGNENIAGTKTFGNSPQVPTPLLAPDATPKSYVDGLNGLLSGLISTLQTQMLAVLAVVTGLTFVSGSYPGNLYTSPFFYIKFPNNMKLLWIRDAGSAASNETITFPSVAQGFPGFANPPTIWCNNLGPATNLFSVSVDGVTSTAFNKRSETFGNPSAGAAVNILALGV
jgi:hypothetical protein